MIEQALQNPLALELHPLCTLFPRMNGAEFEALKADIIANGLREPIVVHEGMVLDGGNRYLACREAGIAPTTTPFCGGDPISFVLSANFHRRHLSAGQQAAVVAAAQDWSRAHQAGGDRRSKVQPLHLDTAAERAKAANASLRTQRMADKVAKQSPELARQVAHGEISLPKALEQLAPRASAAPAASSRDAAPPLVVGAEPARTPTLDQQTAAGAEPSPAAGEGDEPDAEPDPFEQLIEENKALEQEKLALAGVVRALNERIAILTQDDLAAAADEWKLKFEQLSGRNRQLQETAREAQLGQKGAVDLLAKIRKALGVESNAEILPTITRRRAA